MHGKLTAEWVAELARYAELPFDRVRAEAISDILGPALVQLRAIRPVGYENLAPDLNFRVPVPASEDDPE